MCGIDRADSHTSITAGASGRPAADVCEKRCATDVHVCVCACMCVCVCVYACVCAQTFPGARILRGFRAPSHAAATPRPSPEHVFYVVFVSPATPQLRPDLPQSTYFTWFSCTQPLHSYAQTFPGARILRGFRPPSHATATPRPSPEHVFCVVFVPPATPHLRPDLPRSIILHGFRAPATPQLRPDLPLSTYFAWFSCCLLYTSPSPRDYAASRMPSSA